MWKLLVLAGWALSSAAGVAAQATAPPKKYIVNLDLAPEKRWQEVALDHTVLVKDAHEMFK